MRGLGVYEYRVTEVLRVVDGDTVDLRLDVGFHLSTALRFRLLGVDTPERYEPGWRECTVMTSKWLSSALSAGLDVRARTVKTDSFGRWLADVFMVTASGEEEHLSTVLADVMRVHGWSSPAVR